MATRFDEFIKKFITLLNDNIISQKYSNEFVGVIYLSAFSKWLVYITSKFYKNIETTIATYELKDENVVRECPIFFTNEKPSKKQFRDDDSFWEWEILFYRTLLDNSNFKRKLEIYEDLSTKPFDLEIFKSEIFSYSPYNLHINLTKEDFLNLREGKILKISLNDKRILHLPYPIRDYHGHKGELNGYSCDCSYNERENTVEIIFST